MGNWEALLALEIPLPLLLGIVLGGVSTVVVLSWALGQAEEARLDEDAARAAFAVDHPDCAVRDVTVGTDGRGALLQLEDGTVGAVFVLGDRYVTRRICTSLQAGWSPERGLQLHAADPKAPRLRVAMDADAGWHWVSRLAELGA